MKTDRQIPAVAIASEASQAFTCPQFTSQTPPNPVHSNRTPSNPVHSNRTITAPRRQAYKGGTDSGLLCETTAKSKGPAESRRCDMVSHLKSNVQPVTVNVDMSLRVVVQVDEPCCCHLRQAALLSSPALRNWFAKSVKKCIGRTSCRGRKCEELPQKQQS
jgi:hypothetical protein